MYSTLKYVCSVREKTQSLQCLFCRGSIASMSRNSERFFVHCLSPWHRTELFLVRLHCMKLKGHYCTVLCRDQTTFVLCGTASVFFVFFSPNKRCSPFIFCFLLNFSAGNGYVSGHPP
ncbi:unnamed protein product [Discosporangium mesarthrocarpum]